MKKIRLLTATALATTLASAATITSCSLFKKNPTTVTYLVIFDKNCEDSSVKSLTQKVVSGDTVVPAQIQRAGYKIQDWCTDKAGEKVFDFSSKITSTTTLYAKWAKESTVLHTVTFNKNDGTGNTFTEKVVHEQTAVPAHVERSGFTFTGWYDNKEGSGNEFDFNTVITANKELYAKWTPIETKTVTFETGLGSTVPTQTIYVGDKVTKPTDPTKDNSTFEGWYVDDKFTVQFDFDTIISKNITLYAKWNDVPQTYEVYDRRSGTLLTSSSSLVMYKGDVSNLFQLKTIWTDKQSQNPTILSEDFQDYTVSGGWSSSKQIVSHDANHNFTAQNIGTTTITLSPTNLKTISFTVSVIDPLYKYLDFEAVEQGNEVVGYNAKAKTDATLPEIITIPEQHNGKPVIGVAENGFNYQKTIKLVNLPSTIKTINDAAFKDCTQLESINLPEGLTTIGNLAFSCPSSGSEPGKLNAISLPSTLTTIGSSAFNRQRSVTNIVIPKSVTTIGESAFAECSNLKNVFFEEGIKITTIKYSLFESCTSLTTLEIPEGVTTVERSAFKGCSALSTLALPSTLTALGTDGISPFNNNTSLTKFKIPTTNTKYFTYDTTHPTEYTGEGDVLCETTDASSSSIWFIGKNVVDLNVPNTVTAFKPSSVLGKDTLKTITFLEGSPITSIDASAFEGCTSLTTLDLSKCLQLELIGSSAFSGCSSLSSVTLPQGSGTSLKIDDWAFSNCVLLKEITIPSNVNSISATAFNCNEGLKLEKMYFGSTQTTWTNICQETIITDEDSVEQQYGRNAAKFVGSSNISWNRQ